MKLKRISLSIAFMTLMLAGFACGGPVAVGGPTATYEPIPVSTEAVQSLEDKFDSLAAVSGEATVSITESELTSYFNQQLEAQPDSPFSDPQVYLRDGKINLYVTLTTNNLTANAVIIMNAAIVNNKLAVSIESANLGPLPVPQSVLESLTSTINDRLIALAGNLPTGVGLKSITIADKQLTLTAVVK